MNCSLCNSIIYKTHLNDQWTDKSGKTYFACRRCSLIQLDNNQILSYKAEKQRYMLHENSIDNKGYVTYLKKIIASSVRPFLNKGNRILDFGCGPEQTWADILTKEGFGVTSFDPYFYTAKEWKTQIFDVITAIEVFEHINSPAIELKLLNNCLSSGGYLIIRTMLHNNNWSEFSNWWYKDDPTHITFYSKDTVKYICNKWNYKLIQVKDNCEIVLKKK